MNCVYPNNKSMYCAKRPITKNSLTPEAKAVRNYVDNHKVTIHFDSAKKVATAKVTIKK